MLYTDSCFSYLLALSFGIHGIFWSQRWLSHRNIWLSRLDASISTPLGSGVSRGGTFHLDPLETGLQARRPEDAGLECGIQRWKHNVGHLPWSMSMSTWIFWCWLVLIGAIVCVDPWWVVSPMLIHDSLFHHKKKLICYQSNAINLRLGIHWQCYDGKQPTKWWWNMCSITFSTFLDMEVS